MTVLDDALADYLAVRRALGYQLIEVARQLEKFVSELNRSGIDTLTVSVAVDWATAGGTRSGGVGAQRLSAVRGFARYLQALDPAHQVPPARILPARRNRPVPHVYCDTDIDALMTAARTLQPAGWAATVETMIGLLWVTGMRISEVLALNSADFDADAGVLTVWFSKFNKSRHIPVASTTATALTRYRHQHPSHGPLFVTAKGERVSYPTFKRTFDRLIDTTAITTSTGRRPRVHDVRHSFATTTLLGWYRSGADVHALLPRLSTFLGHVEPASTYWYLTATPELMACAVARLEQHQQRVGS